MPIFNYRLAQPGVRAFPGAHPGRYTGMGQLFKQHVPLLNYPDPRRIDLRRSVLDPAGDYQAKVYRQPNNMDVYVLADLSASMTFTGVGSKVDYLRHLIRTTAYSAHELGDHFGFLAFGDDDKPRYLWPAGQVAHSMLQHLSGLNGGEQGGGCRGLVQAARYLPIRRCLILLLSDFHFKLAFLDRLLQSLGNHAVVPLVLWDEVEFLRLPSWGLLRLRDSENSRSRLLFMRPTLRERIIEGFQARRETVSASCRAHGREPLFVDSTFNVDVLQQYFSGPGRVT